MLTVPDEVKFQALYDHYKDTVLDIKDSNKIRDRLTVLVLGLVALLFFLIISPDESVETISTFFSQKFGIILGTSIPLMGSIVWFGLMAAVMRYFQVIIYVERQYLYLHQLEEHLSLAYGDEKIFTREGKAYLDKYPWFSDWIYRLYTIVFPTSLLIAVIAKISMEWNITNGVSWSLIFDSVIFVFIVVTTFLYLCHVHWKK